MTHPKLYLSELIEKGQATCRGYLELSKRIEAANPSLEKGGVDRRKLKAIVDGRPFTISLDELIALDNYFSLYGESLGDRPLFVRQSLLEGLAENHRIVVLLGAFQRDEETRNDVSLWDVKAFGEIISGMQKFREGIQNTLHDVSFLNSRGVHNRDPMVCGSILAKTNQSICGIGSMRSSVATEIMLANMFQVTAFARAKRPLPFRFIWPEDAYRKKWDFASAFVTTRSEQRTAETTRTAHATGALVVGDEVYDVIPKRRGQWDDFGIIAVQRRKGGRVWLVVAGISGITTYAAAVACRTKIHVAIPQSSESGDSPVLWAVVRARVSDNARGIGDTRYLESVELLQQPQYWTKSP